MSTFTWGCPNDNALGLSETSANQVEARPRAPLELLSSEIFQAAAGQAHTLWLDGSGRVWASGRNNEGQCGFPRSQTSIEKPHVVTALNSMYVTHVAAGALSSACIVDGRLYEWGFCCTSLKETSSSDAGADITDVSYEDAMESMVQLTGLASRLRDRPELRRLVTQSNLQYLTGENKGYHSGHHDEEEGGNGTDTTGAAVPHRTQQEQEEHFRELTKLAQRVMRLKVRRMPVPQPTEAIELQAAGSPVIKVAIGYGHTVALCEDGSVWSKGYNDRGQLMQGHRITLPFFVRVPMPQLGKAEHVVDVQCGTSHTLLLTSAGKVYAAGGGGLGQLGQERRGDRLTPVRVTWRDALYGAAGCNVAVSIAAGANHSCIVDASGAVWTFGHSEYSQMDPPTALEEASREAASGAGGSPASVGGASSGSGNPRGDHSVSSRYYFVPRRMVGTGTGVGCVLQAVRVFSGCGCNFMAAACADGRLMTWGWNAWNVLGRTANMAATRAQGGQIFVPGFGEEVGLPVRTVACGQNHTVVVTEPEGHRFARGWDVLLNQPRLRSSADCLLIPLDGLGGVSGGGTPGGTPGCPCGPVPRPRGAVTDM